MVRRWLVWRATAAAAAALAAGSAWAEPDWRAAGGEIFAGAAAPLTASAGLDPVRVPDPAQPLAAKVEAAAAAHRLDPKLLHALVLVESGYRKDAVSPVGAAGLTQLMPGTAQALGVMDRFDPDANLSGGAAYLARQLVRFGDLRLALAAYNAGPARVLELGRVPEAAETQQYVARVLDCYLALAAGRTLRTVHDCRPVSP